VALARGAEQVRAPDEQVARPVRRVVGVFAAQLERAALQALDDVRLRVDARRLRRLRDRERIRLQLRRRRQPAHSLGAHVVVDHRRALRIAPGQRRADLVDAQALVAPLVRVRVEEARRVLLARRTDPVEREGERRPPRLRPQLLLPDVVRPASAALPDAAAQHQQVDDAAVVHVAVVPVVHRRADDHHRLAARLLGVLGELARDSDHLLARNAGDRLLPGRRVRNVVVEAPGGRRVVDARARDAIVGDEQVVYRRDEDLRGCAVAHDGEAARRHAPAQDVGALFVRREVRRRDAAEVREADADELGRIAGWMAGTERSRRVEQRESQLALAAVAGVATLEIPLAAIGASLRAPAETDRAVRHDDVAVRVEGDRLPLRVIVLSERLVEVAGAQVASRREHRAAVGQLRLAQFDEHRQVGVAARVIVEVVGPTLDVEFAQDHVAHRHRERRVSALLRVQPEIGELRDLGVVGRDRDHLRALVAHLGEEVRVGRPRLRNVRAPRDQEGRVVPVGGLGNVGLLAPGLRARRRQVAIPVVEAHAHATDQRQVARAGGVRDHRHRRNRREAEDAVGPMAADRVDVGGGDDLVDFVPRRAHEAAHAALLLPAATHFVVADDRRPCVDRGRLLRARRAPRLQQPAAHHRVFHAVRAVQVPAVARPARATARLVVRQVGARARVIRLLRLPGDDAALDVDLPRARTRAVRAVRRAHDLVVLPAVAIRVFPGAVFAGGQAVAIGENFGGLGEEGESIEQVAHSVGLHALSGRRGQRRGSSVAGAQVHSPPLRGGFPAMPATPAGAA